MAENSNEIGGNELGGPTNSSKVQRANGSTTYDKSQTLVDIANNTFRELCRTLENEQTKLMELEERRKKLQEEMQRLKMEIEEEKQSYRLNLVESVTDNLEALNACSKTSVAFVDETSDQTESVHEFIERQKAEIQRLTSENTQMPPLEVCMELDENDKEYQNEIVKEDEMEKDIISNKDVVRDNGSNDASLNHPDKC